MKKKRARTERREQERARQKSEDPLMGSLKDLAQQMKVGQDKWIEENGLCGLPLKQYEEVGTLACLLPKDHSEPCALWYPCACCGDFVPWPHEWPVTAERVASYNFCSDPCKAKWKKKMEKEVLEDLPPGSQVSFTGPGDRN